MTYFKMCKQIYFCSVLAIIIETTQLILLILSHHSNQISKTPNRT